MPHPMKPLDISFQAHPNNLKKVHRRCSMPYGQVFIVFNLIDKVQEC